MSELMKQRVELWAEEHKAQVVYYPELRQRGSKGYFIANEGKYAGLGFIKSLDAILTGASIEYRSLTEDAKESYLHRLVNSQGYTILEFPDRYHTDSLMLLQVPNTNETWSVTPANFEIGRRPRGVRGSSLGELFIRCVLDYNNISYKTEVSTVIKGNRHRFDFVLATGEHIEFQGEQHFKEVKFSANTSTTLADRKHRDLQKKVYCEVLGVPLIEVCFPANLANVTRQLQKYLPVALPEDHFVECYMDTHNHRVKRIAEYYKEHSGQDTSEKFHVSRRAVVESYKLVYGRTKGRESPSFQTQTSRKANEELYKEIDTYFLSHTARETASKFSTSAEAVRIGFARRNGMAKRAYLQSRKGEQ